LKAILAIGTNHCLCDDYDKADRQWFKRYTLVNKNLLVGRKTQQTLPRLKGRLLTVLTRSKNYYSKYPDVRVITSPYFINLEDDYTVIGGAEIYNMFWENFTEIALTQFHDRQGDALLKVPALNDSPVPWYPVHETQFPTKTIGVYRRKYHPYANARLIINEPV